MTLLEVVSCVMSYLVRTRRTSSNGQSAMEWPVNVYMSRRDWNVYSQVKG